MQRQLLAAPSRVLRVAGTRQASTVGSVAYNTLFRRNATYATYIFGGAIILEAVYGNVLEGMWATVNKGVSLKKERKMRGASKKKKGVWLSRASESCSRCPGSRARPFFAPLSPFLAAHLREHQLG